MPSAEKLEKKNKYFQKLVNLCVNYPTALIVNADHVGSKQMQDIRMDLRGKAEVLMGKNTMIRKALSNGHEEYPDAGLEKLRAIMVGNIGFIFAKNCTLDDIREVIGKRRLPAAAKAGVISMVNMSIPAGPTGMDPSQTAFFQALNIGTKIVKGQIELVSDFPIRMASEMASTAASKTAPSWNTSLTTSPYSNGLIPNFVSKTCSLADTLLPSFRIGNSETSSICPFTIFVPMFNAWKKAVCEGSMPVGPEGMLKSTMEITPALAAAGSLRLPMTSLMSSKVQFVAKMKPRFPTMTARNFSRPASGYSSCEFESALRIMVFLPNNTVALPRRSMRMSCICLEPTWSALTMRAFG